LRPCVFAPLRFISSRFIPSRSALGAIPMRVTT
jgi:hypothetical protein